MSSDRPIRRAAVALLLPFALVAAACDPVPHGEFTVVELPDSGASFRLLSGDGNYVVVEATSASSTVPAAGHWRIDRRDMSLVQLPAAATRISSDGSRILLVTGELWTTEGIEPAQDAAVYSDDLTAMAFSGTDGTIQAVDLTTGETTPVEPGFPRPWFTRAGPLAVSADGDTVTYQVSDVAEGVRTVDLSAGTMIKLPYTEETHLSADGAFLARGLVVRDPQEPRRIIESWVRLHEVTTGAVVAEYDAAGSDITSVHMARQGTTVWITTERWVAQGVADCPPLRMLWCVVSSRAVMLGPNGRFKSFDTGPYPATSVDISSDGRFLLLSKQNWLIPYPTPLPPPGPVVVYDWLASDGGVEVLSATAPSTQAPHSTAGQISDDGRLIATASTPGGWYEYEHVP